eukprot:540657_1
MCVRVSKSIRVRSTLGSDEQNKRDEYFHNVGVNLKSNRGYLNNVIQSFNSRKASVKQAIDELRSQNQELFTKCADKNRQHFSDRYCFFKQRFAVLSGAQRQMPGVLSQMPASSLHMQSHTSQMSGSAPQMPDSAEQMPDT